MAGNNSSRIAVQVSTAACDSRKHSARLSTFKPKMYKEGDVEVAVDNDIPRTWILYETDEGVR